MMWLLALLLFPFASHADYRVVNCDETKIVTIYVRPNFGTIINFPVKPDSVLLGSTKQFSVQYIKNDVALTSLSTQANTNMYVYLFGRRCSFLLTTSSNRYDNVVRVRDPDENNIRVKIND